MDVIYAEKPDMGEKIASALGGTTFKKSEKKQGYYKISFQGQEYAVTWGYGHLCALADASQYNPDYKNWAKMPVPFIPENYRIVLNLKSQMPVKEAYNVVKGLFSQARKIINATDFDREGELIFYYLYSYMGCRKPVMRAKLSSTTKNGILDAFRHLIPSADFAGLLSSAQCRSIADWVVGCNLTAAMTLRCRGNGTIYPVGRVQTPTLAMVVARDEAIRNFHPEDYYTVEGKFVTAHGEKYKGVHKRKKFQKKEEAEAVLEKCKGAKGVIIKTENSQKRKEVPNLYNLDTLQIDANSRFGFSLKKTLDITQKLYEKGFVTYPRTDCQFLPEDMMSHIEQVQQMLRSNGYDSLFNKDADIANMQANKKRFFDDTKLGSHYAIIPTEVMASNLDGQEEKVYGLIADSVIRMLYPPAVIENTRITTDVNGESFLTTGTCVSEQGWMFVHGVMKEEMIPYLVENETVDAQCELLAKKTEPPKHYTDKTLLTAMVSAGKILEDEELKKFMSEKKIEGIGTVATRGAIVEGLINRGFLTRDKKNILATERGTSLIHSIPVEEVKSAVLTAKYEKKLDLIADGKQNPSEFLREIYADVREWCGRISKIPQEAAEKTVQAPNTKLICPVCGSPLHRYSWGYGCTEYKNGCRFSAGAVCGKSLTESQLGALLSKGRLGPISGFKKKNGEKFDAVLVLEEITEGEKVVNYKISFDSPKSKQGEMPDIYARCPNCNGKIVRGKWGWECENKCGISVPYVLCSRAIEPGVAETLLAHKKTDILDGFISKKNRPFSAGLEIVGTEVKLFFPKRESENT